MPLFREKTAKFSRPMGNEGLLLDKAELLQLKPHPFICMRNFMNKKFGNRKN